MLKIITYIFIFISALLLTPSVTNAGWVNGYFRSNGTYVNGYYRTDPDMYKWNNYSFDGDWADSYNDTTYYRNYGYDPEPYDNDYVSDYSQDYYWDSTYDSYDYDDYDYYDSYDSYDYDTYDYYDSYNSYDWWDY